MKRTKSVILGFATATLLMSSMPLRAQQTMMNMDDMPMGQGMGMMGMMRSCPMMGANGQEMPMFGQGRIAFLKAELGITEAQADVWKTYSNALEKNMQSMHEMRKTMMTAMSGKTPVERLDAHIAAMDARHQSLKTVRPALDALYAALSAEQKGKADQILTGMGCMM